MEAMSGISLAKFRDKQLEALLSRELPKGWDVMEYEDREPCVFSLPEVYLLWHTDLDRFLQMKMAKSSKRKDTLSAHVDDVLWYIGRYYDAAFQRETENFIERVIETLYEQLDEWKVELDKVTFQDKQLAFEIDNILRNLFLLRRKLYKFISYNKYWLKDTSYGALSEKIVVTDSITEKQEQKKLTRRDEKKQYHQKLLDAAEILKETFQLSEISALKRYVSAKTLKVFFIDEKRYGKIFRECKELDTIYKKIFCGTQKIYQTLFGVMKGRLHTEVANCKNYPITYDLLVSLEYGLSTCYHPEAQLLFLYDQYHREYMPETLKMIIEKNENFCDDLYQSMCQANGIVRSIFETDINYKDFAVGQGRFIRELPKRKIILTYQHSLTDFRRMLLMYLIVFPRENLCSCVRFCLRNWNVVLQHTKICSFFYDERQCILSDFLIKTGMNQKELAEILGVSAGNVSKELANGNLFRNPHYAWFWMAITGLGYDYFTGVTTTKIYGRNPNDPKDKRYLIWAFEMTSVGGSLLKAISELSSFKKDLLKKDSPYKAYEHPLYGAANRELTAKVYRMTILLKKIHAEVKKAIRIKNKEEISRLERLRKEGEIDKNENESPEINLSEIPQYQSFVTCLDAIVGLLEKETEKTFPDVEKKEPSDEAPK